MARRVRFERPDGSIDYATLQKSREKRQFRKQDQAEIEISRSEAQDIQPQEMFDEVFIEVDGEDFFGGLLEDTNSDRAREELIVDSMEQYGIDAEPAGGAETPDGNTDADYVEAILANVDQLSPGRIEITTTDLYYEFDHISRAKQVRQIEEIAQAEARYNPDRTVDWLQSLGRDLTDQTISPSNQNIVGDMNVEKRAEGERATHVKALGAGEGEYQITATAQVDSWEPDQRRVWRSFPNKDLNTKSSAQLYANTIADEIGTQFIDVSTIIKGTDVKLGDRFHVDYPPRGLSRDMRVVECDRIIDSNGIRYSVVLSTRQKTRNEPEFDQREDVSSYNTSAEGVAVPINISGGHQPVTPNRNYALSAKYPEDVLEEVSLDLRVWGLPYTAYSSGAAASGGAHTHEMTVSSTSGGNSVFDTLTVYDRNRRDITVNDSWSTYSNNSFDVETSLLFVKLNIRNQHVSFLDTTWRLRREVEGETIYYPLESGSPVAFNEEGESSVLLMISNNLDGDNIYLEGRAPLADQSYTLGLSEIWRGAGVHTHQIDDQFTSAEGGPPHTHDPSPGVFTEFDGKSFYPENSNVIVNGEPLGVNFGSGSSGFDKSVDISGELTPGQNTVEITSDSIGHMIATVEGDLYRLVRGFS